MTSVRTLRRRATVEVYLDRGEHNAVDAAMVRELTGELERIGADESAHVVIITGAGRSFCPGADLKAAASPDTGERLRVSDFGASALLHEMPQLTVAAINGACAGAGLGWAAACDLRIASSRARFSTAFLQAGNAGDTGGAWTLARALGGARARDLFFLAGKFDAAEAERIGFVSRVIEQEGFLDAVREILRPLADCPPHVLRMAKANFVAAERMEFAEYLRFETERHLDLFYGQEAEASRARLARRGREVSHASGDGEPGTAGASCR
jgi:2-(1,2-epoxy-1,2-dihydrophenyl)acetyl-CoA isomerase